MFVSYYWPPSGKASLHLPLQLIKHLPSFDWQPVVLTVLEDGFSERDDSLLQEVDPNLAVYKTEVLEPFSIYRIFMGKKRDEQLVASETISKENTSLAHRISVWIRMNLFIPDARVGWYPYAKKAINKILIEHDIKVIVSIGPPHSSHLAGWKVSGERNIPFIPVFIDPWVDIIYYRDMKRSALTLQLDNYLEGRVLKDASAVVFVTGSMRDDYCRKYPSIKEKSEVLYWGYNEANFANLSTVERTEPDAKVILHAGNIFDFQNPVNLWKYINKQINAGEKIQIKFIGSVAPGVKASIKENGLQQITEYGGFLPYGDVLKQMMAADYLLVCATEKRHLPGKLFEYMRSGKPIIAFGDDNTEVEAILHDTGAGVLFNYTDETRDYFKELVGKQTDQTKVLLYDRRQAAGKLSTMLQRVIDEKK